MKIDAYLKKSGKALTEAQRFADAETRKILSGLGASVSSESALSASDIVRELREQNTSFGEFLSRLDIATYDLRSRAAWNARMGYGFVKLKLAKEIAKKRKAQQAA